MRPAGAGGAAPGAPARLLTAVRARAAAVRAMATEVDVIESLSLGRNFTDRADFHFAIIVRLTGKDKLDYYRTHPAHQRVLELIKPAAEKVLAVDFDSPRIDGPAAPAQIIQVCGGHRGVAAPNSAVAPPHVILARSTACRCPCCSPGRPSAPSPRRWCCRRPSADPRRRARSSRGTARLARTHRSHVATSAPARSCRPAEGT